MSVADLIKTLQMNRLLRSPAEVEAFDDALAAIADLPEAEIGPYLPRLFLVFDDACVQPEVMWGLLHLIEDYDLEPMMRAYVSVIPTMLRQAPDWTLRITNRVLNSEHDRRALKALLSVLPSAERQALHAVLAQIASKTRYEEKKAQVQEVLA
jgi:primosomal protein N'